MFEYPRFDFCVCDVQKHVFVLPATHLGLSLSLSPTIWCCPTVKKNDCGKHLNISAELVSYVGRYTYTCYIGGCSQFTLQVNPIRWVQYTFEILLRCLQLLCEMYVRLYFPHISHFLIPPPSLFIPFPRHPTTRVIKSSLYPGGISTLQLSPPFTGGEKDLGRARDFADRSGRGGGGKYFTVNVVRIMMAGMWDIPWLPSFPFLYNLRSRAPGWLAGGRNPSTGGKWRRRRRRQMEILL